MSKFSITLSAAVAVALLGPVAVQAQRALPASFAPSAVAPLSYAPMVEASVAPSVAPATVADAPTISRAPADSTVAQVASTHETSSRMTAGDHANVGPNVGLMIVGGAALITGAVIGGSGGTLLAIGGAGVGLYGLYRYVH